MIRFFRRIRHQLLTGSRFSRYLIYAVGEIILVVIGILIALSINNWNEARKQKHIVDTSLVSLKLNLEEDITHLKEQEAFNEAILKDIDFAFKLISFPKYANRPYAFYADSIIDIVSESPLVITRTTFQSMESGAHFQWIARQALAESIYRYYGLVDELQNVLNSNKEFVQTIMEPFVYNDLALRNAFPTVNPYADSRSVETSNTRILSESVYFENILIGRKFRLLDELESFEDVIARANQLIRDIDAYLRDDLME